MKKKYAVVSDALTSEFIFSKWYKYYSEMFGSDNIYLSTYKGCIGKFNGYQFGSLEVIGETYNDDVRKDKINDLTRSLLNIYEVVIRVDVDEFLIPENTEYANLKEYLDLWEGQYITAKGFNLFQLNSEETISFKKNLLQQRKYICATTSMNKTCVTRTPLKWGRGFHYCNALPKFDELLLIHTKRIDINMQVEWYKHMLETSGNDEFVKKYYNNQINSIKGFHKERSRCENIAEIEERNSFIENFFLDSIKYNKNNDIYEGIYQQDDFIIPLPEKYQKYF